MPRILRRYMYGNNLLDRAATEALTIYHVTDSHIWSAVGEDPNAPGAIQGNKLFYTVPSKMRDFVAQANEDQPHVVLHTGDIVEKDGDFAYFRTIWDTLDSSLPIALVPGNHDYTLTPDAGKTIAQTIADRMGYGTDPIVAGSGFHKSRSFSGNGVSVRIITIDTNTLRDSDPPLANGHLTQEIKDWIASELAASAEDIIFLASHHAPHQAESGWFDSTDADDLQAIVDAECAARPNRKITHLFGHRHGQTTVMSYHNRGIHYPGLLPPVVLEYLVGGFAKYHIFPGGRIIWEVGSLHYTA